MDRIDKLTKEQEKMVPIWRDKWIKIGLKTGETNWEVVEKYLPICYEKANIKYPKNIVRVSSPLVGAFAASIADRIWLKGNGAVRSAVDSAVSGAVDSAVSGAVRSAVGSAVRSAVGSAVRSAVDSAVSGAVGGAVDSAVSGAVRSAVRSAVGSAVRSAVDSAVSGAVDSAVSGAVGGAVDSAVSGAVGGAVSGAKNISWHYWLGGQFWVGGWWSSPSYVSFFTDVCGLKLSKDIQERATAYRMVCESANYIWVNRNFVIICARPRRISRNNMGRLHSDTAKSIEYPDGWGLYHLNGVLFPESLWTKVVSRKMPMSEIMAIVDVDQRTQAMKYGDFHEFAKIQNAKCLDKHIKSNINGEDVKYELWEFPKGDMFIKDVHFMWYTCPSTKNEYVSGVWGSKTVAEAMARKQGMTEEMWLRQIPLLHES